MDPAMMDIDQIAQRLEELSVDADMPILADLAEALIHQETSTCGPECATAKQRLRNVESILGSLIDNLERAGFRVSQIYNDTRMSQHMHQIAQYGALNAGSNQAALLASLRASGR